MDGRIAHAVRRLNLDPRARDGRDKLELAVGLQLELSVLRREIRVGLEGCAVRVGSGPGCRFVVCVSMNAPHVSTKDRPTTFKANSAVS